MASRCNVCGASVCHHRDDKVFIGACGLHMHDEDREESADQSDEEHQVSQPGEEKPSHEVVRHCSLGIHHDPAAGREPNGKLSESMCK